MLRRFLDLACFFCCLLASVPGTARIKSPTLAQLVRGSHVIGVVHVDRVVKAKPLKVAVATVVQGWHGLVNDQRLAFVAQPSWGCDGSHAVEGETIVLFAARPQSGKAKADGGAPKGFGEAQKQVHQQFGAQVVLYGIYYAGRGRLPIVNAKVVKTVGVILPRRWKPWGSEQRVRLADLKRFVVRKLASQKRHPQR